MEDLTVNIKQKNYPHPADNTHFTAIKNLEFEQLSNEFICIVGPSGCGKTTLLNIIGGLDTDFDGDIQMGGHQGDTKAAFVFQTPRLLPWRTVLENIQLAHDTELPIATIEKLLSKLGLEGNLHSYPQHLSLGMLRRVSLARAFSINSDILLMDEPFVSLDLTTAKAARQMLLTLWQETPRNLIFVTHDINEAIQLADRILFLSDSPSHIISEVNISKHQTDRTDEFINTFKNQLQSSHPQLTHFL